MITEKVFTYPFEDERWVKKFAVGSALVLASYVIPFIPFIFVLGYALEAMRGAIERGRASLPEWEDWGMLGLKGIFYLLITLGYMLPSLFFGAGGGVLFIPGSAAFSTWIAALSEGRKLSSLSLGLGGLAFLTSLAAFFLCFILALLGSLVAPLATAHYLATGEVKSAFHLRQIWATLRAGLGEFIIAWAMVYGLAYALSMALSLLYFSVCLCLLTPLLIAPVIFYFLIFQMPLFGLAYRAAKEKLIPSPEEEEAIAEKIRDEVEELPAETPLEKLGLSMRTLKALKEAGLRTAEQVEKMSDEELLQIKSMGPKTLQELKTKLGR